MHSQGWRDSARDAAPNIFDWRDPPGKPEWPNGDWEAAQGGHPRQEGGEGTAQETHAAEASAVHRCRLGARALRHPSKLSFPKMDPARGLDCAAVIFVFRPLCVPKTPSLLIFGKDGFC